MSDRHDPTASSRSRTFVKLSRRTLALSLAGAVGVAGIMSLAAAAPAQLVKANVKSYNGVLENAAHHTLYLLTIEKGGVIHCTATCEKGWFPLLVKSSVKSVATGAGVVGKIGFVTRTKKMKQVTYNGYPVYTFVGDTGANQSTGQGVAKDGGTWYLVSAGARTASATMITHASSGATTTTKPATTTTKPLTTTTKPVTTTTQPVTTTTRPPTTTTAPGGGGSGF